MSEIYTSPCTGAVQATMQSCAQRVNSLRTECTKSYGTLTDWPGPCECTYYAQDLMCFDEQALCASQAWSQVPQWFRDGVSSCLAKDARYTVRAELGAFQDPFTVSGLAGSNQTNTGGTSSRPTPGPGSTSSLPTQTRSPDAESGGLSGGAVAGVVVACVISVSLVLGAIYLLWRRRQRRAKAKSAEGLDDPTFMGMGGKPELDATPASGREQGGGIHEMESSAKDHCRELEAPRTYHELPQPEKLQQQREIAELPVEWPMELSSARHSAEGALESPKK